MTKTKIDAILIAGPTASGKSACAVKLAKILNGVVINADSMQVYSDLSVITARPGADEQENVDHVLYGHVDGAVNYSVGHYLKDAAAALEKARCDGFLPIVVGGTGLYFKALTDGLSDVPPVPDAVRAGVRALAGEMNAEELHAHLAQRDPIGAERLRASDSLRVQRALEVFEATGRSLTSFHDERAPGPLGPSRTVRIFLDAGRDALRRRIDDRFEQMIAAGALAEIDALRLRRLDPMLPVMRAHGVPGLVEHLEGRATLAEAVIRGQGDTRRYAKRQFTWFRHQMPGWTWVSPDAAVEEVLRQIILD